MAVYGSLRKLFNSILNDTGDSIGVTTNGLEIISSDKDTHFTGAIAQNAGEEENITGLAGNKYLITGINIISDERLDWELQFYSKNTFGDTDIDTDTFLGAFRFVASDGKQVGGTGSYYFSTGTSSNNFPGIDYEDLDASNELHVKLVNRNSTSKTAGASGEARIVITAIRYD